MRNAVSLQINLAPPDAVYVSDVLPHQLRVWADQVADVVLTVDNRRPRGKQFGSDWDSQRPKLLSMLTNVTRTWPVCRVVEVDYSPAVRASIANSFFGGRTVPMKDFRGGPYYSYFYGLQSSHHRHVLHLDADMMFGGLSENWLGEALETLAASPEVLFVNPFPGPPPKGGALVEGAKYHHERSGTYSYRFSHVSTRVFLVDLQRMVDEICPLGPEHMVGWRMRLGAIRTRRSTRALPEDVISRAMARAGLCRLDMLGSAPGMWTVHPVVRDEDYLRALPALIERIERGDVTDEQVGQYNLDASMLASVVAR